LTTGSPHVTDDTGSHTLDRVLSRELVRAALFERRAAPRIGRFLVAERLGAGASSVVYAAWDEPLARRVAVKVFVAESSATRLQVQREARALAQLSHRNVVAVFEVGEWNDHAFIAMELVIGTTLSHWQADPDRTTAEILDAYLQAGRGLAAAHRAGLVHRDFKPANVMVAGDGRVVVTDFGLVGEVAAGPMVPAGGAPGNTATGPRSLIGTPAYAAPEQRHGAIPHPSADLYSFALSLCEALIGWHPRRHPAQVWDRALARRVPPRLRAAIRAGLAEDPAARGPSLDALLDALAPPKPRIGGRRAVIGGLAIAVTAAVLGVAWYRSRNVRPADILPPAITMFHALAHRSLADRIDALVAAPPPRDDARALTELRSLLLEPLPRELGCAWPTPVVMAALGEGFATGIDREGRVHACTLDGGDLSLVATDARCMAVKAAMIGVIDQAGHPHVVRYVRGGWEPVRPVDPFAQARCPMSLLPEPDGMASITSVSRVARDPAARITATIEGTEVRIVAGARSTVLAARQLPGSPIGSTLDVSRDGSHVLVGLLHGPLLWWEAGAAQWRQEPLHFEVTARQVRLSPSGTRALLVDEFGRIEMRTLGGGRTAWLTSGPATDTVFGGDDTVFALDADARIWRWELANQRAGIAAIHYPHLHHDPVVWSVASNAQVMASGSEGGTAMVVDRGHGGARLQVATMADIYTVTLDADRLVTGGNGGLQMWNWRDGTKLPLADGSGLRAWVVKPARASDGARVYLAGMLNGAGISLWRDTSRRPIGQFTRPSTSRVLDLAIAADGRTAAAVTSGGELVLIDVAAERIIAEAKLHATGYRVAFDPATATVVTAGGDGYLRTWSADDGTPRRERYISASAIYSLDVHGGRAVTASRDGSVALIDLATGQLLRKYRGHPSSALTARFRAGGQWFVTGDESGRACLWRVDDVECHTWLDGHTKGVVTATFADDGTIFTGSKDGTVRFWHPTYDAPVEALLAELAQYGSRR
jgi:WD40 repeat protein/predicted Ser/Thr protein kinase